MNRGLKNEVALLVAAAAAGLWLRRKRRTAKALGLLAFGLRVLPLPSASFKAKSVVITGGSRGLGLALAEQFVREGAVVTLLARDQAELSRAKANLEEIPSAQVLTVACDITNHKQVAIALEEAMLRFSRVDILVNNAGAISVGPFESMDPIDFQAQMRLHFDATVNTVRLALPYFRKGTGGRIVNISSIGGRIPVPHLISYCASKFALSGFSETLAAELHKDGVSVTTVYPGLMRTGSPIQAVFKGDHEKEFAWFAFADSAPLLSMSAERAARQILNAVRQGRTQVILSLPAKAAVLTHALFPEIFAAIMRLANRLLPQGQSHLHQTGAKSGTWLLSQRWSRPILGLAKRAQSRFNQTEHMDPDFNLGAHGYNLSPR